GEGSDAGDGGEIRRSTSALSSLDEIKRQMGKSPEELERNRKVLEDEMKGRDGGGIWGDMPLPRGPSGRSCALGGMSRGEASQTEGMAHGLESPFHRNRDEEVCCGGGEEEASDDGEEPEAEVRWRENLVGLSANERGRALNERGHHREALRWHLVDLDEARAR
ncbi:unnamed protein product, partial [Discosporangium mesarthrocarpum]